MQDSLLMAGWSWLSDRWGRSLILTWRSLCLLCADGSCTQAHAPLAFPGQTAMVWTDTAGQEATSNRAAGPCCLQKAIFVFFFFFFFFLREGVTLKPRLDWNSGQSSSLSLPSGGIETRIFKAKVNRKGWPYPICKLRIMMKSREKRFIS